MNNLPRKRKRAVVTNGPKFWEETPKKGGRTVTPITVLHCKKVLCASKTSKHKTAAKLPFFLAVA
jgi:hypothetical protein